MIKSNNFMDNSDCPIKATCGFYDKTSYNTEDIQYYVDHCLNGGEGCGLQHHRDITEKLKDEKI